MCLRSHKARWQSLGGVAVTQLSTRGPLHVLCFLSQVWAGQSHGSVPLSGRDTGDGENRVTQPSVVLPLTLTGRVL